MFKKIPVPSKNLYEFLKIVGVDQLAGGVVHLNRRAYARAIARENYCVIVMTSFLLLSHLAKMECEDCKCSFMKISKVNSKRHTQAVLPLQMSKRVADIYGVVFWNLDL